MPELTSYALEDGVAVVTMDDGKANALSIAMLAELREALDRAERDEAVVVLTGREGRFSAGFDLKSEDWPTMLADGARLAERLLSFPRPVVAACNGHALAMAGFVLLSCDVRIGTAGDFKIGLNEVAIGLTVPWFGIAVARHRLTRPYYDRCLGTGVILGPEEAQRAGFLDHVMEAEQVLPAALQVARAMQSVDARAHLNTKLRIREQVLAGVRDGIARIGERAPEEW
jgi:enoyl-CoA hydratase